eukprot:1216786-Amphidinium_carterae.1
MTAPTDRRTVNMSQLQQSLMASSCKWIPGNQCSSGTRSLGPLLSQCSVGLLCAVSLGAQHVSYRSSCIGRG